MMKARVVREFIDKNTRKKRVVGMVFELSEERFKEIQAAETGFGFQLIEAIGEAKKEEPKTEEPKVEEVTEEEPKTEEVEVEVKKTAKKTVSKK